MTLTKETAFEALRAVRLPGTDSDLVESEAVESVAVCDGRVRVVLGPRCVKLTRAHREELETSIARALRAAAGEELESLTVELPQSGDGATRPSGEAARPERGAAKPQDAAPPMHGVKHIIAVGAGKGGVGKSTIAVNLAIGLSRRGHAVGLMDGDIYGPSLPTMLGLDAMEAIVHRGRLQPFAVHGIKAMTIGKLVDPEKPLVWRGPMAHGAFKQLTEQTDWGELDYLIIDLPPGTGDVSLTMAQTLQLTGAVVVCTPQRVAQDDAVRAARMFHQLGIEVLGVVENMSYFIADDLSPPREYDLFGRGGAEQMAQRLGVPFLGAVPITIALRRHSDSGDPVANFLGREGDGPDALAKCLDALAAQVERQADLAAIRLGRRRPTLTIR